MDLAGSLQTKVRAQDKSKERIEARKARLKRYTWSEMAEVLINTNVLLRFILGDDEVFIPLAKALFQKATVGEPTM